MKKMAGTINIDVQSGQNCATATHVEMRRPESDPR